MTDDAKAKVSENETSGTDPVVKHLISSYRGGKYSSLSVLDFRSERASILDVNPNTGLRYGELPSFSNAPGLPWIDGQ